MPLFSGEQIMSLAMLQKVKDKIAMKAKWVRSQLVAVQTPEDECDEYEQEHFSGMVDAYSIALSIIDEEIQRQISEHCVADDLNDALNLIGKYCGSNLADGWQLSIHHDKNEQWIELCDSQGDEHDEWMDDSTHAIVDACDCSLSVEHG